MPQQSSSPRGTLAASAAAVGSALAAFSCCLPLGRLAPRYSLIVASYGRGQSLCQGELSRRANCTSPGLVRICHRQGIGSCRG